MAIDEREQSLAIACAEVGTYVWYVDLDEAEIDEQLAKLMGFEKAGRISASGALERFHPDDRRRVEAAAAAAFENGKPMREAFRYTLPSGEIVWLASRGVALRDEQTGQRIVRGVNFDVTAEYEWALHSEDVASEMGHRVKNILTVITGMTRMIDADTMSGAEHKTIMLERLDAISGAHDLIYKSGGEVTVPELARRTVFPLAGPKRAVINGPSIILNERAVQTLTMALTELATNALKHGALRTEDGHVDVNFAADEVSDVFSLRWAEQATDAIKPPTRSGFGTAILDRVTSSTFGGRATFEWHAEGLTYTCVWPLSQLMSNSDGSTSAARGT